MNINAISYINSSPNTNQIGKRCAVSVKQPVPEAPKDEVTFKGYDKYIRKIAQKSDCESFFFELFEDLLSSKFTRTEDFKNFKELYEHRTLHGVLKDIAGEKFSSEVNQFAGELLKKSQKQDVVLASCDGFPVLELHSSEMPSFLTRHFALKPENVVELKFNSELGGSSCIFGLNPRGELTLKQISNMDLPKYTSFYDLDGKVKVFTSGIYESGNFVGDYFNKNGLRNPFLSMFLH